MRESARVGPGQGWPALCCLPHNNSSERASVHCLAVTIFAHSDLQDIMIFSQSFCQQKQPSVLSQFLVWISQIQTLVLGW